MAWNTSELFQRTFASCEHSLNRGIESTVENTNGLHCKSESAQVHNVHHGRTKPKNTEIRGKVGICSSSVEKSIRRPEKRTEKNNTENSARATSNLLEAELTS